MTSFKRHILILFSLLLFCNFSSFAQFRNVLIGSKNEPEEVTICINPKNPARIAAGSNINNYFFSSDTGKTWHSGTLGSKYGVWGDPCIIADTSGNFYYFHLSNPTDGNWVDRTVCQKSTDGGISYSSGTYSGLNGKKVQDKHWAVFDPKTNGIYVSWTQFDKYQSKEPNDSSHILFTSSFDGAQTWSKPVRLDQKGGDCSDDDKTVEGAVPTVGPNGEIYVAWAGEKGIFFDRSLDSGKTWLNNDIFVSDMPGGWVTDIAGLNRCNGMPVTCCDISNSPYKGTIYINWADERNGGKNNDIFISSSTDNGNTWSKPLKVNNDTSGNQQFLPWMAVDPVTGSINIVFYDRRHYNDKQTDVYLARSTDGGKTFKNVKISNYPFSPISIVFMGDYNNISSYNDIIRPIWTRLDEYSRLSVWTAIINGSIIDKQK
jgi:hypothetical protein